MYPAPSFSSFPSFDSFPDTDPGLSQSRKSEDEKSKKKKKQKSHSSKNKDHSRKHERDVSQSAVDVHFSKDEEATRFYYADRKADHLNIEYGRLYQGDIPKYSVVNHGRKILGLDSVYTAFSRSDRGIEVGIHRRLVTLDDRSKSQKLLSKTPRRIGYGNSTKYQEVDGFLPLPSRRGRNFRADEPSYRFIDNENDSDSASDSVASSPCSSDDEHVPSAADEALRHLEQQLSADPSSITNWLALLSRTLSKQKARGSRSAIALPVLARALSAHPANSASVLLRIKYLKAGADVWDDEAKLRYEWEDALKLGSIDLWMEWFEWKISKAGDGLDGVVDAALRILSSLDESKDSEVGKVRVFWRTAIAFRHAGYHERATAMFQAQAELTFEIPQTLYGLSLNNRLTAFEEFWDAEVPRMGELHSKGWAHWASQKQEQDPVSTPSMIPKSTELDPYRQWAEYETTADRGGWLPIRSTNSTVDSDPYSMVLFTDIRSLLLDLRTQHAKHIFRLAWLSTMGLHLPGFSASLSSTGKSWDDRWSYTHLANPAFLDAVLPGLNAKEVNLTADALAGALVGRQKVYRKSFGPVKNWSWGSLRFFEPIFGSTGMWEKLDVTNMDSGFVNRVFSSLRLGPEDVEWDLLSLMFEAATSVKSALKLSRLYLSTARDSLPHWAAHAQLERMRGKLDDARNVYQTILIASAEPALRTQEVFLWWDWAEMEWLSGHVEDALPVILRAAKVEGRGGVAILRARRALNDSARDGTSWQEREAWTKLGALLDLLTSHDVRTALSTFEEQLGKIEPQEMAHESLTMASLLFLYRYGSVLKNPVPPSILRGRVIQAMEYYPSNSVILALFLEVEKGQGVWGRIRGTLGDNDDNMKDVARRVQEVWIAGWESGRWEAEIERTRTGLSAAVEHERTKGSSQIWRIYIEFEIRATRLKTAKELLFRAIDQCPRCKDLYLLAFGPLRSVFEGRELNSFAEVMAERGIRMRKGLDEVLEEWGPRMEGMDNGDLDNDQDDEIEFNARELRRLKPY